MANEIIVRDVAFTLPNATGNFTITDTGGPSGLTPKAVMIVLSGATALDTLTQHARMSIGITDGTNHRCTSWMAEDNVLAANADTGKRLANDKLINITATSSEALSVGATFVSVGTNAITINVGAASVLKGFARFYYGADLTASVTSMVAAALADTATTAPGFTPDGALFFGVRSTNDYAADAGLGQAHISIGAAGRLPSTTQACISLVAEDRPAAGNSSVASKPRDNRVAAQLTSSSGVITEAAALSLKTWDTNGLTLTNDGATAITVAILALRLNGERCHAGCPMLNSDTTGVASYTTPGHQPRSIFIGGQVAPTVNTSDATLGGFSIGVATTATGSKCAGWNANDNKSTTEADCIVSDARMVDFPAGAASILWACSLSAITATGFDYNVLNAHTGDLPTLVFCLGDEPQTLSPTGIASTAALGTPTVLPTTVVSPTGIASTAALGLPFVRRLDAIIDYGFRVQPFACPTASGDQTITITSASPPGKKPKAALFLISGATGASITSGARLGGGMTDGTTHLAFAVMAEHGIAAASRNTGVRSDGTACIQMTDTADQTKKGRATFVEFVTDGIKINWASGADTPAIAYFGRVIFFYGDDTIASVHKITGSATLDGTVDSPELYETPDLLIALSVNQVFGSDAGFAEAMLSFGSAGRLPSVTQSCLCVASEDLQNLTAVGLTQRDDCLATRLTSAAGTVTEGPRLEASFPTNKFRLTTRNAAASLEVAVLALSFRNKIRSWCGAKVVTTSSTGSKVITDPNFEPLGLLLYGVQNSSLNTLNMARSAITLGGDSGMFDGDAGSNQWNDVDSLSTSSSQCRADDALASLIVAGAGDYSATLTSLDQVGFTLGVGTAGAGDRGMGFTVLEKQKILRPTGIASTAALGTPSVSQSTAVTLSPTGIASTAALGTPTVSATITLSPAGIASTEALGTPSVSTTITLSPAGIASTEALGTPTVLLAQTVALSGIASIEALGTPSVSTAITLSPTGIASTAALGTPTVSTAITLSPTGIASTAALGTPSVSTTITLSPTGIASTAALGTPSVSQTTLVSPSGIASSEALGTPSLFQGTTILPAGIASSEALGAPSVSQTTTLSPSGIASSEALGTPMVQLATTISPAGIASTEALGTPTVSAAITLSPAGIASTAVLGAPSVSATVTLSPAGIASTEALGTPTVSAAITLSPTGIASAEALGTPTVFLSQTILLTGIASSEALGTPTVTLVGFAITLFPDGIASAEALGRPFVTGGLIPTTMKKRIHDALCEAAHLGTFIAATYPVDDEGCVLEQGLQVQPKSVEVNEIQGSYSVEGRQGRSYTLDRSRWLWLMILRFDQEVVAELFERRLEDDPILICPDPTDARPRQARLRRVDCDYRHPPRGNPSNGTELRYRFEAELSPK